MPQDIFPTSYGRKDGHVVALRMDESWLLRSTLGPAWFWNHVEKKWVINTTPGFDLDTPEFRMTAEVALGLLPTIEPVKP